MKLRKWLKQMDQIGLNAIIWTQKQLEFNEKEPLYSGFIMDIPWYLAEYKLYNNKELPYSNLEAPITYFDSLKECNDGPGFMIIVEEPE
jgi:hypothetical protein